MGWPDIISVGSAAAHSAWPRLTPIKAKKTKSAEKTRCQACVPLSIDGTGSEKRSSTRNGLPTVRSLSILYHLPGYLRQYDSTGIRDFKGKRSSISNEFSADFSPLFSAFFKR